MNASRNSVITRRGRGRAAVAIAAIGALALALAACSSSGSAAAGSSGSSSPSSSSSASSSVASSAPSSESSSSGAASGTAPSNASSGPAALVPATIRAKGTLINATDATYPPYEFVDADGHTLDGFDPELVQEIAKVLDLKIESKNVSFAEIIPGIVSGKYDMGASSFIDTAARQKQLDFVTTEQGTSTFYVKAAGGKTYQNLDALCGASVAVENATTQQASAQEQSKKCVAAGKSKVTVLTFSDQNAANLAVSSGRADLGFADLGTTQYSIKQSNGQFKLTGAPMRDISQTGIGLPKGNGMAKAVQAAVQQLIDNGTYKKLLDKWGISAEAIPTSQINIAKG